MSNDKEIVSVSTHSNESGSKIEATVVTSRGTVASGISRTEPDWITLGLTETAASEKEAIQNAIDKLR